MKDLEIVFNEIKHLLESNKEWLLIHLSGENFCFANDEIELDEKNNKIFIGFLDEKGFQTWRIVEFSRKTTKSC